MITDKITIARITLHLYVEYFNRTENNGTVTSNYSSPRTARNLAKANGNKRAKSKKVKILIFLVSTNGSRIQKVAELKKSFNQSQWQRVSLPVYLTTKVAEANSNNTLYLRVECKKCNKKTQISLTGKCDRRQRRKKSKHGRKEPRSNKICNATDTFSQNSHKPFITIESNSYAPRRNKRTAGSGCDVQASDAVNRMKGSDSGCCRPSRTFVEMNDLNLDHIVIWPSRLELLTCTGTCGDTSLAKSQSRLRRSVDKHIDSSRLKLLSSDILRLIFHHHLHSPEIQLRRKSRSLYRQKWTRPKSSNKCVPVETEDLVLLHFTPDQTLAQTRIPNLLITKCGCKADHSHNVN